MSLAMSSVSPSAPPVSNYAGDSFGSHVWRPKSVDDVLRRARRRERSQVSELSARGISPCAAVRTLTPTPAARSGSCS